MNEVKRNYNARKKVNNNQLPAQCFEFGPNRKETCKDYYFCHGCDLVDALLPDLCKRVNS